MQTQIELAAETIGKAEAMIVSTGAGMGVDSGLPDFRGDQGFWNAYPMYKNLGVNFVDAANPRHFSHDPEFGWGFYGHRLDLYRNTIPHKGFRIILDWIDKLQLDYFVVTSNVDGQFQKAGYLEQKIYEVHGSIHHLQCTRPCNEKIWVNQEEVPVNLETMRAEKLPSCTSCHAVARPNILMFGDFFWNSHRSDEQEKRFHQFLDENRAKSIVVIEIGAGTAVPTIRMLSERVSRQYRATVIRINPRESLIFQPNISLPFGGVEGLELLDRGIH